MNFKLCMFFGGMLLTPLLASADSFSISNSVGTCTEVREPNDSGIELINATDMTFHYGKRQQDRILDLSVQRDVNGELKLAGTLSEGGAIIEYPMIPPRQKVVGGKLLWAGQFSAKSKSEFKSEDGASLKLTPENNSLRLNGDVIELPMPGAEKYTATLSIKTELYQLNMKCSINKAELAKVEKRDGDELVLGKLFKVDTDKVECKDSGKTQDHPQTKKQQAVCKDEGQTKI